MPEGENKRALIAGNVYDGGAIVTDGNDYHHCTFQNCKLIYRGGLPPGFSGCAFDRVEWALEKEAANTLAFLRSINSKDSGLKVLFNMLFGIENG